MMAWMWRRRPEELSGSSRDTSVLRHLPTPPRLGTHLRAPHADDPIDVAARIVEEGDGDGVFAGREPVAFGGRVDLEDVSSGTEDGLLPLRQRGGDIPKIIP